MTKRLVTMGQQKYAAGFNVRTHEYVLHEPLTWYADKRVFVCSMSDLFHEQVPDDFIEKVLDVMRVCSRHTFQVLTKRPERATNRGELLGRYPENMWLGTSVEDAEQAWRLDYLKIAPAVKVFVSYEPLLGPVPLPDIRTLDWVIVGGESGPGARPMNPEWARDIRDECARCNVPFFMKQMARREPIPPDLQIREFPCKS